MQCAESERLLEASANATLCPLSTFHRDCRESARKEDAAFIAGKTQKADSAFGKVSPISVDSSHNLRSVNSGKSLISRRLLLCCCYSNKCGERPLMWRNKSTGSDNVPARTMKGSDRGSSTSNNSLSSTGSIRSLGLWSRFIRRKSSSRSGQTLLNADGQLPENSPADLNGTPSGKRTTSLSHLPSIDGRESSPSSASVAATSVPVGACGSTMSLSSIPHSHNDIVTSTGGMRNSLPVLPKEPPPAKFSTMPAPSQQGGHSGGHHHNNGSLHSAHGLDPAGKSQSNSSHGSSGYGSSSSSHYKGSGSTGAYPQGMPSSLSSHAESSRQRSAGSSATAVSESQKQRILQAATEPLDATKSSRKQDGSSSASVTKLTNQFDPSISIRPRARSALPAPRPTSYHDREDQRHITSSCRRPTAPVIPMFPMTSTVALQTFHVRLTDYEQEEILEYSDVHYLGLEAKKIGATRGTSQNHGYDEENGSYMSVTKDHIAYRFEIKEVLGKGSFGHVVKALDHRTNHYVAIKIIRNKRRFHQQAQVELKILANLNRKDKEGSYNIIRMEDSFHFRNHLCIVFELMGMNLYEVLKANSYRGFSLSVIRKITYALLQCLKLLRRENIIHCDLKPENILLRPSGHMAVKVIDFGSSCYEHQRVYTYIQSRFYRSPEVILGLPYTCAIDMWSLGCILPELYTGYPLFPGENENEQLACIMQIKGLPPSRLLESAPRRRQFFDSTNTPRNLINSKGKRRPPGTRSMANACDTSDPLFINFIQQCLHWEASQRMLPDEGLRHPWIIQGRLPRTQAAGYTSDSTAMHGTSSSNSSSSGRARSGTTSSVNTSSSGSGSTGTRRHHASTHGTSSSSSAHTSSLTATTSLVNSGASPRALQRRPQPIGAEQPSEPITKSTKCAKTTSMSTATTEESISPPLDKVRHVVGATSQEKTVENSKTNSASWSNPSSFLTADIV